MKNWILCLALFATSTGWARPLFEVGVLAGVTVEANEGKQFSAFAFDASFVGRSFDGLFRLTGTNGSIDYLQTGYDRLSFTWAGAWRVFGHLQTEKLTYGRILLRRLAVEGGCVYERAYAPFADANHFGFHLALRSDFPLSLGDPDRGPSIRLLIQRSIYLNRSVFEAAPANPIDPGDPDLQILAGLNVVF